MSLVTSDRLYYGDDNMKLKLGFTDGNNLAVKGGSEALRARPLSHLYYYVTVVVWMLR